MSNDLISRKALFNKLFVRDGEICPDTDVDNFPITFNVKSVRDAIRNSPTAYDVDRILEKIEEIEVFNGCCGCEYWDKCKELRKSYNVPDNVNCCALTVKRVAIEIVKSGGEDNK